MGRAGGGGGAADIGMAGHDVEFGTSPTTPGGEAEVGGGIKGSSAGHSLSVVGGIGRHL